MGSCVCEWMGALRRLAYAERLDEMRDPEKEGATYRGQQVRVGAAEFAQHGLQELGVLLYEGAQRLKLGVRPK